ncbi:cell division protein ZapB [Halococcus qingdaonensis]|uniref:cell division protein ZapB n=1 Tax=Halococcus qingdaonensis TaxID=224402 RepID=UPI00211706CB|nr:cell division protein ZapB [Halococcus qingdaonensis]
MTSDRAFGTAPTDPTEHASSELIAQLIDRVETLEAENERLHDELDELHDRQREDCHALARENHELRNRQDRLQERVGNAEDKDGYLLEDIVDLEEQLSELEERSAPQGERTDGDSTPQRPALTPIERVARLETEEVSINVTPSIERAVVIFDHWHEWSTKTPNGRVLKDGLKELLCTATDERLAWRQVYRAANALEELSKGNIELTDHSRHGKMLVESQSTNRDCRASSAATP